jgi:hypothetical protein
MEYSVQDIQNLPIRIIGKVVELRRRKWKLIVLKMVKPIIE